MECRVPHILNMISTTEFNPKQKLPLYGSHGAQMLLSSVEELDESQNNKLYILIIHILCIIKISLYKQFLQVLFKNLDKIWLT